ncbi:MAG TPA: hypothetical protein VN844_10240 [Pyrinomonadaceae bacterium]|nr:hypothetical protein [Pyrinomonadaceae bacterium]
MTETDNFTLVYSILSLHQALIAVLYADHIEHDKKLRDVGQNATESLQAFRNYTKDYLNPMLYANDAATVQVGQGAKDRVSNFFREVESILLQRGILDKRDPSL